MIKNNGNISVKLERLEKLKQATITNFLDEVDFDNKSSLYDTMFKHLVVGDLDEYFYSYELDDVDAVKKKKIQALANEYFSLCFYDNKVENWAHSIDGVSVSFDNDLISMKVLDNYNFLLRLARDGREVLELVKSFQSLDGYKDYATIEYLRNNFYSDEVLEHILCDMSKEDSDYNIFDIFQKAYLCSYSEGTLYYLDNDVVNYNSPLSLACDICNKIEGNNNFSTSNLSKDVLEELVNTMKYDNYFNDIVFDMNKEYKTKNNL